MPRALTALLYVLVAVSALCLGWLFADAGGTRSQYAVQSAAQAQVHLHTAEGHCSGVHIGAGRVLTAGHCTTEGDITAFGAGLPAEGVKTTVLWVNAQYDIALLALGTAPRYVAPLACDAQPAVGSDVTMVGDPSRFRSIWLRLFVSSGILSISYPDDDGTIVVVWAEVVIVQGGGVVGGASGSPIFDSRGRLVGILVGGPLYPAEIRTMNQNIAAYVKFIQVLQDYGLSYYVPASAICALVKR